MSATPTSRFLFPIAFPAHDSLPDGALILAADVGGTKTDLALFEVRDGGLALARERVYRSQEWPSLTDIIRDFSVQSPRPQRLSIAFAGPIRDGRAQATNLDWSVDSRQLSRELGIAEVLLINDLEAAAYGLAALKEGEVKKIYPGQGGAHGNAALIAPGTGLGEAGLFWDGQRLHPFATEGGHADFSPHAAIDWQLLRYLQGIYGHVSWERVVSGPGIHMLFRFLHEVAGREAPEGLMEQISDEDPAAAIGQAAREGCPICVETIELFTRYLAEEAANLALKLKATGGLFIGGGIPPKIWTDALQEVFLINLFEVGRMRPLVEAIPVYLILNTRTALLGAGYYGAFGR